METDLRKAYANLYDCVYSKNNVLANDLAHEHISLVSFTTMQGYNYFSSKDINGNDFRFMLVGRAVNGWNEYHGVGPLTRDTFVNTSIQNLKNEPDALVLQGRDRFEWIATHKDSAINTPRYGIDRDPDGIINKPYHLTRSPFWAYTKEIWNTLYGTPLRWEERWFENIIWSNLYKIAPQDGGNPDSKLIQAQEAACVKLLQAEIDFFKPTHIFFVTGTDWFEPFKDLFVNKVFRAPNIISGEKKNEIYVEGTAEYVSPSGVKSKVIIACRPECRTKHKYVVQISDYFAGKRRISDTELIW